MDSNPRLLARPATAPVGTPDQPVWTPPGPGPWQQDSAHNPRPLTAILQQLYPSAFHRGFEETFAEWGVLLDRLAMGLVNGFSYHQPQPFDLPGPDGPRTAEWTRTEIGRRTEVAATAFATERWRAALREWDEVCKPASIAAHAALGAVALDHLDADGLVAHLRDCVRHVQAMVHQHHRFNGTAMIPIGDFMVRVAGWVGLPPAELLGVLDGYSPCSGLVSEEAADALREIRCDPDAVASLRDGPFDDVLLAELCGRFPAVRAYVELVTPRLVDGFDVDRPTLGECPEVLLGKLAAGLDADPAKVRARSDAFAASLRVRVPEPHRFEFDALLAAARSVYRLRDERGVYSDIPAVGLLRLAMLEIGRRAVDAGLLDREEDALDADADELVGLASGAANGAVTSARVPDLAGRASSRIMHAVGGAPRYLGDPPPPHPPVELLPPPLGRVMAAVGFMIDGILGESEHASGSDDEIGGITGNGGVYEGTARLIASADDLFAVEPGEVLVVAATGESFNAFLHLVGAVVTDHGSFASHAAIMARELGFPAVVGTVDATTRVHTGDRVVVDGDRGLVRVLRRAV